MTGEADKAGRFEVSGKDFFDDVSDLAIKLTADGAEKRAEAISGAVMRQRFSAGASGAAT